MHFDLPSLSLTDAGLPTKMAGVANGLAPTDAFLSIIDAQLGELQTSDNMKEAPGDLALLPSTSGVSQTGEVQFAAQIERALAPLDDLAANAPAKLPIGTSLPVDGMDLPVLQSSAIDGQIGASSDFVRPASGEFTGEGQERFEADLAFGPPLALQEIPLPVSAGAVPDAPKQAEQPVDAARNAAPDGSLPDHLVPPSSIELASQSIAPALLAMRSPAHRADTKGQPNSPDTNLARQTALDPIARRSSQDTPLPAQKASLGSAPQSDERAMQELATSNQPANPGPVQSANASPTASLSGGATPATAQSPAASPVDSQPSLRGTDLSDAVRNVATQTGEAARNLRPELALRHAEFGTVNIRVEGAGGDMRATLMAHDVAFVPAVQAALAERTTHPNADVMLSQFLRPGDAAIAASSGASAATQQNAQQQNSGNQSQPQPGFSGNPSSQSEARYGSSTGSGQGSSQPYPEQSRSDRQSTVSSDDTSGSNERPHRSHNGAIFA